MGHGCPVAVTWLQPGQAMAVARDQGPSGPQHQGTENPGALDPASLAMAIVLRMLAKA